MSLLTPAQVLDIMCGSTRLSGPHTFDTAVLGQLTALLELTLRSFAEPCLWGVPRQLRVLRVLGGCHSQRTHHNIITRHFFSLLPSTDRRCGWGEAAAHVAPRLLRCDCCWQVVCTPTVPTLPAPQVGFC